MNELLKEILESNPYIDYYTHDVGCDDCNESIYATPKTGFWVVWEEDMHMCLNCFLLLLADNKPESGEK